MTKPSLSRLVEMAKSVKMTDEAKKQQRCSFVYGNVAIEDETRTITKEMVARRSKLVRAC